MKRAAILLAFSCITSLSACTEDTPQPAPQPAKPVPPPPKLDAAVTTDGGHADARLTMMERHAIWKAKKEADEKLAKELAEAENKRLLAFDKSRLPKHLKLLAFEKKLRATLDEAAEKLKGKPDAAKAMEKFGEKQRKSIEAQGKILQKLDPKGGNTNIGTDHDVTLNLLANDYPAALAASLGGDEKPLADVRAELDRRQKKMEAWLDEAKKFKK